MRDTVAKLKLLPCYQSSLCKLRYNSETKMWYNFCLCVTTHIQDSLTIYKALSVEFIDMNYDKFFAAFKELLMAKNYVTRRVSIKVSRQISWNVFDSHLFAFITITIHSY